MAGGIKATHASCRLLNQSMVRNVYADFTRGQSIFDFIMGETLTIAFAYCTLLGLSRILAAS
jgi:hypothetical protein